MISAPRGQKNPAAIAALVVGSSSSSSLLHTRSRPRRSAVGVERGNARGGRRPDGNRPARGPVDRPERGGDDCARVAARARHRRRMVTAPSQLLIDGKQPGTISLSAGTGPERSETYEVKVRRDLTALDIRPHETALPGETIDVRGSGKDVVVVRHGLEQYVMERPATWPRATSRRRRTSSTC